MERVYDRSYWRCMRSKVEGRDFFGTFYYELFELSPEIQGHFVGSDMRRQRRMLRDSFTLIGEHYFAENATALLRLRRLHEERSIRPHLYVQWLEALLASVRKHDPEYDGETERAWRTVFEAGIDVMTQPSEVPE